MKKKKNLGKKKKMKKKTTDKRRASLKKQCWKKYGKEINPFLTNLSNDEVEAVLTGDINVNTLINGSLQVLNILIMEKNENG